MSKTSQRKKSMYQLGMLDFNKGRLPRYKGSNPYTAGYHAARSQHREKMNKPIEKLEMF